MFCFTVVYRNSCSQPRANVICGRAFARPRVRHIRTLFLYTVSKNACPCTVCTHVFECVRSRVCVRVRSDARVFVTYARTTTTRRRRRRRRRRLRVCFHGYRRRGTRAVRLQPHFDDDVRYGGSRGVVEEGAGRRRIKSSKSFHLSTLPTLPISSSLAFTAFLLYLFCPNHEPPSSFLA